MDVSTERDQALDPATDEEAALIASLVGHTIAAAEWRDADTVSEWTGHEYALLTLDDGRVIRFHAWGHDAWGTSVVVVTSG